MVQFPFARSFLNSAQLIFILFGSNMTLVFSGVKKQLNPCQFNPGGIINGLTLTV